MTLSFIDIYGNKLDKLNVYFENSNFKENKITDKNGIIELSGIEEGAEITCYAIEDKKQSFKFKNSAKLTITLECTELDMTFVVAKQNGDAATDLIIHFEFNGKVIKEQTDSTGQISLKNIPFKTSLKAFQYFNGKEENIELFICEKDKAQYFYVAEQIFEKANMNFKLVDKNGQAIRNSDVRFKYDDKEYETVTDTEGRVIVKNVKLNSIVQCKQLMFGKSLPWHKFNFEKDIDEYVIHGEKLTLFGQENENYDSQVRMKIKLTNSKLEPIANAIIKLEYDEKTRNKYTNTNGEIQIDDVLIGSKLRVFVDVRGDKTEAEFTCGADNEMHKIILKTVNDKLFVWLIPILVIVSIVVVISQVNFSTLFAKKENVIPKLVKDTVIINDYIITVKEKDLNKTLKNVKLELKFKDSTFTTFSDKFGQVKFKANSKNIPTELKLSLLGYNDSITKFISDSFITAYISKNDSFDIAEAPMDCGLLIESPGAGTTYRTFKMNVSKGRFKLFYNMFGLPDKIDVYNGSAYASSEKNIIYTSEKLVKGMKNFYINFDSPDSLVTIRIKGDDNTTKWLYKVFCPKRTLGIVRE